MALKYTGHTLSGEVIDKITKVCKQHDFPLDYAITLLHFEGLWGNSEVARLNNNWGGMTWTGESKRPSGIIVTKGTARPSSEGGHYMRYASVDDFLQDWAYLLRDGGIYKVSGAKSFDEAIKGMFKVGGAKYDYAASGYTHYLTGMSARRDAINKDNNGRLDSLVKNKNTGEVVGNMVTAQQVINEAKKYVGANKYSTSHKAIINHYNTQTSLPRGTKMTYDWDWCAAFVSFILMKVGLSKVYGTEISVGYYKDKFIKAGIWKGRVRPKVGDIIIWQWGGNQNGWPDHIGFVSAVSGDTITTLEGNTFKGGVSTVGYNTFKWNASTIQGYARPNYGNATLPTQAKLTFEQAVQAVLKGTMGNGSTRTSNLRASGQDPTKVQAEVNKRLSTTTKPTPTKTKEQAVKEVIAGKYGSGKERHDKLTKEGFNANEIQKMVNEALKPKVDFSGHKNNIKISKDLVILDKVGGTRRGLANKGTTIKFDEVYINNGLYIAYLNGNGERCYIKIADMDGNKIKEIFGEVSKA